MSLNCKKTRRRFLKAALGCVTAVFVPGVLLTDKKFVNTVTTLPATFKLSTWYKPGIWALPKPIDGKLLEGSTVVFETKDHVHLKWSNDPWKESKGVRSLRPFLER